MGYTAGSYDRSLEFTMKPDGYCLGANNNGGDHSSGHLLYQNLRWKLDEETAKYLILGKPVSYDDGVNGRYTAHVV